MRYIFYIYKEIYVHIDKFKFKFPSHFLYTWYIASIDSVFDATAKIPSGLLNGNVNQFGDFDECVGVQGSEGIQGQYCLAYLKLDVDESRPDLKHLHRLLHAHYAFRSNLTDVSWLIHITLTQMVGAVKNQIRGLNFFREFPVTVFARANQTVQ